ncbi:MAG: peroxiredoxin [Caldisphaera sp.]|uniref:peroxiredoxin n=1 Tax=Caldisphaera sp. TaxID=2060322 RepID=UPI000CC550B4|nr:MAG: peroxiredoxin [Caldisphaera sp.]
MNELNIGDKYLDFSLYNTDLKEIKLSDIFSNGKPVVLLFFPGAFTSVCTKELCTFRDKMALLNKANAVVFGISVDSPFSLSKFKTENKLNFDLLSDYNREVIKLYNVVHEDLGIIGLPKLKQAAKRAVFIFDKKGNLAYKWVSDHPGKEPDYDKVIEIVNSL